MIENKINFRTDLALERRDLYKKANQLDKEIDGIETEEEDNGPRIRTARVKVLNETGAQAIGKPIGNYVTIDIQKLKIATEEDIQEAAEILAKELRALLLKHSAQKDEVLVVGLGNQYVTPDSLGPKVINDIDVTRHILTYMPQVLSSKTRPVSAISPGVLGTTGIETLEILKGIVDNVHPKLLIVIDALASRSIERISSTIQLADTGITPGAGVGNTRKDLSKSSLGIPVIALGIPTVVDAATIAADSLDLFIQKLQEEANSNEFLNNLQEEDKYEMIKQVLVPEDYNFIVTPKEIDDLIENMSSIVARGINIAIQPENINE
ncbi:MAG: GPR endopeptidase [Clostridia bacterium]|nr:GPR endopeptidase [Clostridia bacterium]